MMRVCFSVCVFGGLETTTNVPQIIGLCAFSFPDVLLRVVFWLTSVCVRARVACAALSFSSCSNIRVDYKCVCARPALSLKSAPPSDRFGQKQGPSTGTKNSGCFALLLCVAVRTNQRRRLFLIFPHLLFFPFALCAAAFPLFPHHHNCFCSITTNHPPK